MSEFFSTRDIKSSQKRRRCDECLHWIEIGQPYRQWATKSDGEFYSGTAHPECQDWANLVIDRDDWDNMRPFICDADPEERYGVEKIKDHPPSHELLARLPGRWRETVEAALAACGNPQGRVSP